MQKIVRKLGWEQLYATLNSGRFEVVILGWSMWHFKHLHAVSASVYKCAGKGEKRVFRVLFMSECEDGCIGRCPL